MSMLRLAVLANQCLLLGWMKTVSFLFVNICFHKDYSFADIIIKL